MGKVYLIRQEDVSTNQYGETWLMARDLKELVRCKDCKYGIVKPSIVLCTVSNIRAEVRGEDDYCSKAERRKDG